MYTKTQCTAKNGTFATLRMLQTQEVDVIFGPLCSSGKSCDTHKWQNTVLWICL